MIRSALPSSYSTAVVISVTEPVPQRIISVHRSGSQSAVIWNPWTAKAQSLSDLPDDDYQHFVCVETANA
jgi:glucose-6-phosphate 1-epimerase